MRDELRNHMISQHPVVDLEGQFLFFGNNKVAQQSICRHLLKDRVALWKEHPEYAERLETIDMDKVFKFTIVRNPWSRVVSAFHYLRFRQSKNGSKGIIIRKDEYFKQFICSRFKEHGIDVNDHFNYQHPKVFFQGQQFVDFMARLENIRHDWCFIAATVRCPMTLPKKNQSPHLEYQSYYDEECKKIVRGVYTTDIELLGYTFEGEI